MKAKRLLSVLLVVMMMCTFLPMSAFAAFSEEHICDYYIYGGTNTVLDKDSDPNHSEVILKGGNNQNATYFVTPGTMLRLENTWGSVKWRADLNAGTKGIKGAKYGGDLETKYNNHTDDYDGAYFYSYTKDDDLYVTVSPDAPVGTSMVYRGNSGLSHDAEFYIEVVSPENVVNTYLNRNIKDANGNGVNKLYLTILNDSTKVPGEPGVTRTSRTFLNLDRVGGNYSVGTNSLIQGVAAKTFIKDDFYSRDWVKSVDGSATIGIYDPTGAKTLASVQNIDWNAVLDKLVAQGKTITSDGQLLTPENKDSYEVVPYVVKLQTTFSIGWHVDCYVVEKNAVNIFYDPNVAKDIFIEGFSIPDAETGLPTLTRTVGSPKLNGTAVSVNQELPATDGAHKLTFNGWNTKPDGTGTHYNPGASISVNEDTTLFAEWTYNIPPTSGCLDISKTVVTAEGSQAAPDADSFSFKVTFGDGASHGYTLYDSKTGTNISSGTVANGGTISLKDNQTARFELSSGTSYKVEEILTDAQKNVYESDAENAENSISGRLSQASFVNTYNKQTFTIHHMVNGTEAEGEEMDYNEFKDGFDMTGKTRTNFLYGGTFSDAAMTEVASEDPTHFVPEAGADYYLREVYPYYLQPQYFYIYDIHRGNKIVNVYVITGVDDNNYYKEVGFLTDSSIVGKKSDTTVYENFTVKNFNAVKNDPTTDVKTQDEHITQGFFTSESDSNYSFADIFGLPGKTGYLYAAKTVNDYGFKTLGSITYKAYYITQDNVKVTGTYSRTINDGNDTYTGGKAPGFNATLTKVGTTTEYLGASKSPLRSMAKLTVANSFAVNSYKSDDVALFGITKVDNGNTTSMVVPQGDCTGMIDYAGKDGSYFAGWFSDEAYTNASDFSNVNSEMTTYAKYIPTKDVKINTTKNDLKLSTVNLKSTVNVGNNMFKEVGVVYNVKGNETSVPATQTTSRLNYALNVLGAKLSTVEYTANFSVKGLANNTTFTATPYWVTLDGTTVYGNPTTYIYRLGIVTKK